MIMSKLKILAICYLMVVNQVNMTSSGDFNTEPETSRHNVLVSFSLRISLRCDPETEVRVFNFKDTLS